MTDRGGSDDGGLAAAVAETGRQRRQGVEAAFRASVEERLKRLEAETAEVKSRLNGLLFFIVSTVVAEVLLRLLA